MASYEFEVRLIGPMRRMVTCAWRTSPPSRRVPGLSLRLGRELTNRAGPGRTDRTVHALTEMRLSGLERGSTCLHLTRGRQDELDIELAESAEIDAKFWQLIEAVRANSRPLWVSDLIAESVGRLVHHAEGFCPGDRAHPSARPSGPSGDSRAPRGGVGQDIRGLRHRGFRRHRSAGGGRPAQRPVSDQRRRGTPHPEPPPGPGRRFAPASTVPHERSKVIPEAETPLTPQHCISACGAARKQSASRKSV